MFPVTRLRRLRQHPQLREMVRETRLTVENLIQPLFVRHGAGQRIEIRSMPGQFQLSIDELRSEVREIAALGIRAVILFGIPATKDAIGSDATDEQGIVQQAVRAIKEWCPELYVITDVCLCEFTDHGHCGLIVDGPRGAEVDNDSTLPRIAAEAVSYRRAGADMVAPSGMMDGAIAALRDGLDAAGFEQLPIMSYAAKFASGFYGPFRDAAESAPQFGDRRTYQMDPRTGTRRCVRWRWMSRKGRTS
ncbi:MAG: porphobilinogen synthase [Planctomycetaceae bacterium]